MRRLANLSPRQRLIFGGAAVGGLVVLIILILLISSATSDAAEKQPIAFNHNKHVHIADNIHPVGQAVFTPVQQVEKFAVMGL